MFADFFDRLLGGEGPLAPHGYCLVYPELIWTHIVADALIGFAYASIPIALAVFLMKRRDMVFGWMVWLFVSFITLCGATHFFSIWTIWRADYGPEAVLKAVTGVVSVATAAALWPLLPRALALPSPAMLQRANDLLSQRILERDRALALLERETTERLRAEEMLAQAQKMEAIGQLTGGIAHDFNNLLTVISANLARARRLIEKDPVEAERSAARAAEGAERAAALTSQLLAFARKTPLATGLQPLEPLIARVTDMAAHTLGPGIRVTHAVEPDLWPVIIDETQIETALLNLLVNARDAMPDGGTVSVTASNRPELADGVVEIVVADTGEGMDETVLARAFEPFFTTKPVGKGTGLGLSQVYGFITQSGGSVELQSAPGAGTRVVIRLPRGKDLDRDGGAHNSDRGGPGAAA